MITDDSVATVVDAVAALGLTPRKVRWASLSSCVVDAVWSIGAKYDPVTVPITRGVFDACLGEGSDPLVAGSDVSTPDPIPLAVFSEHFPDVDTLLARTNRQRTSTRSGILKADAVLRHVAVLTEGSVQTRHDAAALIKDDDRFNELNSTLKRIPGEGGDGVRRGYLWMLVGNDDGVKPDRMVSRWLAAQGVEVDPSEARVLLRRVAAELSARSGKPVTPWMVDHHVWLAGRLLPPAKRRRRPR